MTYSRAEVLTDATRSREEVETLLTAELRLAMERFQSATSALMNELTGYPSGAAGSEHALRLELAREAKASAAAELRRALRRHNRFILDHELPEDLREHAPRPRAHAAR